MQEKAQWTWLVYMAGDNNLQSAGLDDLNEMRQIGSTPQVNVLVQFDTEQNKTTRYLVEKDRLKTLPGVPGCELRRPEGPHGLHPLGRGKLPRPSTIWWTSGITAEAGRICRRTSTTTRSGLPNPPTPASFFV